MLCLNWNVHNPEGFKGFVGVPAHVLRKTSVNVAPGILFVEGCMSARVLPTAAGGITLTFKALNQELPKVVYVIVVFILVTTAPGGKNSKGTVIAILVFPTPP
jgi:hypothetical protein